MQIGLLLPIAFYAQTLSPRKAYPRIGILLASYFITFWAFGHQGPLEQTRFVTIVFSFLIITAVMQYSRQVQHESLGVIRDSASRDRLTGLPNVYALRGDLDAALSRKQSDEQSPLPALIVIDLDDFRRANSAAGHRGGDEVLRSVADHLNRVAGASQVYRVGGDEFALIVHGLSGRALTTFAQRCAKAIEHDVRIGGVTIAVAGSVGCAAWTPSQSAVDVMEAAEEALRSDKADRRGGESKPTSVLL
jgi:diguanylate cyclase (GGDEF)-like protein